MAQRGQPSDLNDLYVFRRVVFSGSIIAPSLTLLNVEESLILALAAVTEPYYFDRSPYWKTNVGTADLMYLRFVCGEFVRRRIHKDFGYWKPPQHCPRDFKALFRLEADLWGAALEVAETLYRHSPTLLMEDPALVLLRLIRETELVHFISTALPIGTVTDYIKDTQSENAKLQKRENPFNRSTFTGQFINLCLTRQSSQMKDAFKHLVEARMRFTSHWKSIRPSLQGDGVPKEKRGRKPNVQPKKRGRPNKK